MQLAGRRIATFFLVVVGTVIAAAAAVVSRAAADAPPLTPQAPPVTKTVMLVGDSVPKLLSNEFAAAAAEHGYDLVSAATGGCPATGVRKVYSSGKSFTKKSCPNVLSEQDRLVERYRPALVIWWSRYELAPRLGPDGKVLTPGSRAYLKAQEASFDERVQALTRLGARLVTVQIERPGPALAARNPAEKYFLVGQTLLHRPKVVQAWNAFLASHKGPTVFSISIDALVCHGGGNTCDDTLPDGEPARPDGIHYSQTAQRLLAPPIFAAAWRAARLEPAPTP